MTDNPADQPDHTPEATPQPVETLPQPGAGQNVQPAGKAGKGIAVLALLLALLAAGGTLYLWYLWHTGRQARLAQAADLDARAQEVLTQVVQERDADLTGLKKESQSLKQALANLETQTEAQDQQGASLRAGLNKIQYAIKQVQGDIATLKGDVEITEGNIEIQKADTKSLLTNVNNLKKSLADLRSANETLEETVASQQETDQIRKDAIAALQEEVQGIETHLASALGQLQNNLQNHSKSLADLDNRIEDLQLVQRNLLTNLNNMRTLVAQGGDVNALVLSEVEYLLRMAQHKLNLQRDVAGAIAALQVADERLDSVDENRFQRVQRMIEENITTLKGLDLPDRPALAHQIVQLEERLNRLPLRIDVQLAQLRERVKPNLGERDIPTDSELSWWQRASDVALRQLKDIVVVRNERSDALPLLAPDEEYFLLQNLRMELEAMRMALLSSDVTSYLESVAMAHQWVRTYFDTDDEQVQQFLQQLEKLKDVKLDPFIPDIGDTLQAFQEIMDSRTPLRSLTKPAAASTAGGQQP